MGSNRKGLFSVRAAYFFSDATNGVVTRKQAEAKRCKQNSLSWYIKMLAQNMDLTRMGYYCQWNVFDMSRHLSEIFMSTETGDGVFFSLNLVVFAVSCPAES